MYSVVRGNFYDSRKLSRADKEMKKFHSIHAAQPGYRGNCADFYHGLLGVRAQSRKAPSPSPA